MLRPNPLRTRHCEKEAFKTLLVKHLEPTTKQPLHPVSSRTFEICEDRGLLRHRQWVLKKTMSKRLFLAMTNRRHCERSEAIFRGGRRADKIKCPHAIGPGVGAYHGL